MRLTERDRARTLGGKKKEKEKAREGERKSEREKYGHHHQMFVVTEKNKINKQ